MKSVEIRCFLKRSYQFSTVARLQFKYRMNFMIYNHLYTVRRKGVLKIDLSHIRNATLICLVEMRSYLYLCNIVRESIYPEVNA